MSSCDWLNSLTIMSSRVVHVVACVSMSFFFTTNIPSCGWTTFCLSIHRSMDTWAASAFWGLQTMLLQTNGCAHVCSRPFFDSLGYIPRSKGLDRMVVLCLNLLRICHTTYHSIHTILQNEALLLGDLCAFKRGWWFSGSVVSS